MLANGKSGRTVSQDAHKRQAAFAALAALGDPTRRAIFEQLAAGASPVGELARHLPVGRPAVSQHLKVLKDAGLVIDEQQGTRRLYRLDPKGLLRIRAWLDGLWGESLAAFKAAAERPGEDE